MSIASGSASLNNKASGSNRDAELEAMMEDEIIDVGAGADGRSSTTRGDSRGGGGRSASPSASASVSESDSESDSPKSASVVASARGKDKEKQKEKDRPIVQAAADGDTSRVIVINPGSHTLRIGLANSDPFVIPHVIACLIPRGVIEKATEAEDEDEDNDEAEDVNIDGDGDGDGDDDHHEDDEEMGADAQHADDANVEVDVVEEEEAQPMPVSVPDEESEDADMGVDITETRPDTEAEVEVEQRTADPMNDVVDIEGDADVETVDEDEPTPASMVSPAPAPAPDVDLGLDLGNPDVPKWQQLDPALPPDRFWAAYQHLYGQEIPAATTCGGKPVDYIALLREVQDRGGPEDVTVGQLWSQVGKAIGVRGTSMSYSMKTKFARVFGGPLLVSVAGGHLVPMELESDRKGKGAMTSQSMTAFTAGHATRSGQSTAVQMQMFAMGQGQGQGQGQGEFGDGDGAMHGSSHVYAEGKKRQRDAGTVPRQKTKMAVRDVLRRWDGVSLPKVYGRETGTDMEAVDEYVPEWIENPGSRVFGDDALRINPSLPYSLVWPFRASRLAPRTIQQNISLIHEMWASVIKSVLKIPKDELPAYRVVLVLPDLCPRFIVAELCDYVVHTLGCSAVTVIQESIAASFGAGTPTACVVDIGHSATTVVCVEDGTFVPRTRRWIPHGGEHIASLLAGMMTADQPVLPFGFDLCRAQDALLVERVKESLCHLSPDRAHAGQSFSFLLYGDGVGDPATVTLHALTDALVIPPMLLFHPELGSENSVGGGGMACGTNTLSCRASSIVAARGSRWIADRVDARASGGAMRSAGDEWWGDMQALAQAVTGTGVGQVTQKRPSGDGDGDGDVDGDADGGGDGGGNGNEDVAEGSMEAALGSGPVSVSAAGSGSGNGTTGVDTGFVGITTQNPTKPLRAGAIIPLDRAIADSIKEIRRPDLRLKLFNSILLVGGSSLFPGLGALLEGRVVYILPDGVDRVSVVEEPKEVNPVLTAWRGGAVLAALPSASDMWVSRAEWTTNGMKKLHSVMAWS